MYKCTSLNSMHMVMKGTRNSFDNLFPSLYNVPYLDSFVSVSAFYFGKSKMQLNILIDKQYNNEDQVKKNHNNNKCET